VANAKHVEAALKAGVDILWIGARSTVSPFVVQEIADASEKFKKIANVIGIIGNSISVLGALASLITLFVPDPVMEKLNSIST
jgi:chorismate mutase